MNFKVDRQEHVGKTVFVVEGYLAPKLREAQIFSEMTPITTGFEISPTLKRFFYVVGGPELGLELGKDLFFAERDARLEWLGRKTENSTMSRSILPCWDGLQDWA